MVHIRWTCVLVPTILATLSGLLDWPNTVSSQGKFQGARLAKALAQGVADFEGLHLVQVKAGSLGTGLSNIAGFVPNASVAGVVSYPQSQQFAFRLGPSFPQVQQGISALGAPLPQIGLLGASRTWSSFPASQDDLNPSVAALYIQNAKLRLEATRLRQEVGRLEKEDGELRQEDSQLRSEDAQLRRILFPVSRQTVAAPGPTLFSMGLNKLQTHRAAATRFWLVLVSTVVLVFLVLWCGVRHHLAQPEDSESESESDQEEYPVDKEAERSAEKRLKALVRRSRKPSEGYSCRKCLCCCGNLHLALFVYGVIVVTALLGAVMWHVGALQPILAQVGVYSYIAMILLFFVIAIVAELWRAFVTLINYIILEFKKLRTYFRGTVSQAKYTIRDFLDDGKFNHSVPMRRPRRPKSTERTP